MTNISQQTLASIVTNNHSTVPVLEQYHLDFCCKGKRTLAAACEEKGLSVEDIAAALQKATAPTGSQIMPFTQMTAEQLIGYILVHHHFYVKQSMPTIIGHLNKVAAKHGDTNPYMITVLNIFKEIQEEMTAHMQKEELVLFPRIKELEVLHNKAQQSNLEESYISAPIQAMESEHDHAGDLLYKIRELTSNYTPPADACTTFIVCLAELKEFEEDLHRHVHLENNLLFPLAKKMLNKQPQLN
jgi:regulator of cell morphogenesis and NO signaling